LHLAAPKHGRQLLECEVFSGSVSFERYCHTYRGAEISGINIKPPSDQLNSLLHARDADTNLEPRLLIPSIYAGRDSAAKVADFQRETRVAMNSYLGSLTSRMALDVGEALLYDSE
jgi:hypothetical protein